MNLIFFRLIIFWMTGQAMAHHGWSTHYDGEVYVTLTGIVTDYQFVNPHAFVYLETVNEAGETESRWCEMQSRVRWEEINGDACFTEWRRPLEELS